MASAVVAAGLVPAAAVGAAVGAASVAATPAPLTAGELVVDDAGGHVFGTAGDVIDVFDLSGSFVTTIPSQTGVTDLMLRGRTLYALASGARVVNAIDADTFAVTQTWSIAAAPLARSFAWAAGRFWITYGDQWSGGLASLDPSTGTLRTRLATSLYAGGDVAATESPARVYVLDRGLSPSKIHAFDITGTTPVEVLTSPHSNACSNGREIALSVDTTAAWTACGSPYGFNEWNLATLAEPTVSYEASPYPLAVTRSEDGRFMVGALWAPYDPDVYVYAVNQTTPLAVLEIGSAEAATGMLAVTSDGSRVFAADEAGALHTWDLLAVATSPTVTATTAFGASLAWTPPAAEVPATSYVVRAYRDGEATPAVEVSAPGTSTTVAGLLAEHQYRFTVAAVNAIGEGPESALSEATTPGGPDIGPFASISAFVQRQFADLLGRAPTGDEESTWVERLQAGTDDPAGLIDALRASDDQRLVTDPVDRLYHAAFLRSPDLGGFTYWTGRVRSGASLAAVARGFAGTAEFRARYGAMADRAFVEALYSNVLGRPGDAGGVDYWTWQLASRRMSRGRVLGLFASSAEYRARMAPTVATDVLYLLMLGRPPTTDEIAAATSVLTAGGTAGDIGMLIIGTSEYAARLSG
ncbi:MAG: DUF4214 domain-containing protein [Actinobacteria bacterium]|nr:DUF4214 domain-containing protein [Actinomycetota bacterium]